jgi:hypothetical protein
MNSAQDTRCRVGCPIRRSRDHRSLASPPGFSQRATSFIASQCQGIHQMPFFVLVRRSLPREETAPPPRTGPNPVAANLSPPNLSLRKQGAGTESSRKRGPIAAVSHEDTSRTDPVPGTRACPPRSHHQRSLHPSINPGPAPAGAAISHFPERRSRPAGPQAVPVVEVNGLEPMTSCLQSRRSPS